MATVFVSGFGFRPADGVRMRAPVVVAQGERALKVMDLSTTSITTDVAFEIRDDAKQSACLGGVIDHNVLGQATVTLRDERGVDYPRSDKGENGIGIGQHEFGFFSRWVSFEKLPADARHVTLAIRGGLGDWDIPVDLAPIIEIGASATNEIGAEVHDRDVTMRLIRAAFAVEQAFIEVQATTARARTTIAGVGDIQRQGDEQMVIVDAAGHRYVEEPAKETMQRQRGEPSRTYAKFASIPADARELTLVVPTVRLNDEEPSLDIPLPLGERREMRLGRYPVMVGPAAIVGDLLNVPGKPTAHGLRFAIGPAGASDERAVLPLAVGLDGSAKKWGWGRGWHAEPGFTNISIEFGAEVTPRSVRIEGAVVKLSGPWEIPFTRPG